MKLMKPILSKQNEGPDAPPAMQTTAPGMPGRALWEQRLTNLMLWQLLTPEQQEAVQRQVAGEA